MQGIQSIKYDDAKGIEAALKAGATFYLVSGKRKARVAPEKTAEQEIDGLLKQSDECTAYFDGETCLKELLQEAHERYGGV